MERTLDQLQALPEVRAYLQALDGCCTSAERLRQMVEGAHTGASQAFERLQAPVGMNEAISDAYPVWEEVAAIKADYEKAHTSLMETLPALAAALSPPEQQRVLNATKSLRMLNQSVRAAADYALQVQGVVVGLGAIIALGDDSGGAADHFMQRVAGLQQGALTARLHAELTHEAHLLRSGLYDLAKKVLEHDFRDLAGRPRPYLGGAILRNAQEDVVGLARKDRDTLEVSSRGKRRNFRGRGARGRAQPRRAARIG
jgi:hypothetical protein